MRFVKRFAEGFFGRPEGPRSLWEVMGWWELRRIPFNLIIGVYGGLCVLAFFWGITTSGHLQPGEDAVEPLALVTAPVAINVFYTLGWFVEIPARLTVSTLTPRLGPLLLKLGLGFGLVLITLPAAFWTGYRLLQLAGVVP
jgi:hypothetical protein